MSCPQHPSTRDFEALQRPSAQAPLVDPNSSQCDQVESRVKAVEVAQIPRRVTRHRKGEESAAQAQARSQAEIDRALLRLCMRNTNVRCAPVIHSYFLFVSL